MVVELAESFLAFAAIWFATFYLYDANRKLDPWIKIVLPKLRQAPRRRVVPVRVSPVYVAIAALIIAMVLILILVSSNSYGAVPTVAPVNVGLPTPYPTMQRRESTVPPTSTPRPLPTETLTSLEYKPDVILKIDTMMLTATPTATPTFVPTLQASPTLSPTEILAIGPTPTESVRVNDGSGPINSSSNPAQPSTSSSSVMSSIQSSAVSSVQLSQSSISSAVSSAASSSVVAPPASSSSSAISIQSSSAEPGGGGGSRSSKSSSTKSGLTLPGTNSPLNLGSFIPGLIVIAAAILAAYGIRIT